MTRTSKIAIASLATLIATAATASAHDRYDQGRAYGDIQAEHARQQAAIEQGRADGSLTWYEKFAINREQARVEQLEQDALADGRLSKDEYIRIRQAQDDAARHIASERHDEQVRGWWWRMWR